MEFITKGLLIVFGVILTTEWATCQLVGSLIDTIKNNILCETNPSHLLCSGIPKAHKYLVNNYPTDFARRDCNFLLATPHCCRQLCLPAASGTCDQTTGACFCEEGGQPEMCNSMTYSSQDLSANDHAVLDKCKSICLTRTDSMCINPAVSTDGFSGYVCSCYCDI